MSSSEPKDVFREVAETVVFVVVLVLLLKTFIAEAFVIPTGSMATTLWGYQKYVECPNCKFEFPVNCSSESDPQSDRPHFAVTKCECPNCRYAINLDALEEKPLPHSGDRVLVFKALYDTPLGSPQRHDVVVFKYPVEPQKNHVAVNYIKRLIGLPGETIAICQGQLHVYKGTREVPKPERFWGPGQFYSWPDDVEGRTLFDNHQFEIIRKQPDLILALSRIVHDNDFQPKNTIVYPSRWTSDGKSSWKGDAPTPRKFDLTDATATTNWLRYRHVLGGENKPNNPQLITDFMGYNSGDSSSSGSNGTHWVGDLILECDVQIDKAEAEGELRLELAKGVDRFQARFNLQTGDCSLFRLTKDDEKPLISSDTGDKEEPALKPTPLKGPGSYHIRLANVDERLTLWVNGALPFGDGVAYAPAQLGPTENDLQPAGIGLQKATGHVAHLKLWRDTYYTAGSRGSDATLSGELLTDPSKWNGDDLRKPAPTIMYVHPGHYLCLGDNSPASADSRSWGMVPEPLMLGRALAVYFPFQPFGATGRFGPIR